MALYACLFLAFLLFSCSLVVCDCLKVDGKENRSFYSFKVGSLAPSTTCYSPKGRRRTLFPGQCFAAKGHVNNVGCCRITTRFPLQNIKKGSQTISKYLQCIKHLSDSLDVVSSPVDIDELVLYALNGIPTEYNSIKTSIRMRSSAISIKELHVLLLVEEPNVDGTQSQPTDYITSAFVTSKSNDDGLSNDVSSCCTHGRSNNYKGGQNRGKRYFNRGGPGSGPSTGHGTSSQTSNNRPCCQICNRSGHTTLDCFHQMDCSYQVRQPPSQLAAMTASYNPAPYQNYYADYGATNHITNDLQNLSVHSDYLGKDKVSIGNGQGSVGEEYFPRVD
ncbi:hypothetical protein MRB53_028853 [Persea americana]|uniref:Uncharacterized protein n=1 Tax=Persea americana TaxID=3435 RepID=A0ACC2KH99_PERAE|nr:hypothetical protein MRB53_028853 [Persea americana]